MTQSPWADFLFEEFARLIDITICNERASVPENNKLLRCFQYLKMDTVSSGNYCWNGDCSNCLVSYEAEDGEVRSALACRMYPRQGMVIRGLSNCLREDLNG